MDPARLVRFAAAAVVFAAVAYLGVAVFGSFADEPAAVASWALVAAIGLILGFATYAIVEFAQTGRIDSVARQFDTRTLVLMPLAISINVVLGAAVGNALKIPIYFDSMGTILVGVVAGPIPGAITGFLSNVLWTYVVPPPFQNTPAAAFAIVAAVIGLLAGLAGRLAVMRPRPNRPLAQLLVGGLVAVGLIGLMAVLGFLGYQRIIGPANVLPAGDAALVVIAWLVVVLMAVAVVGLFGLLFARRDLSVAYVVVAGFVTGVIAALISAPISANLFSGVTGAGTDFLVAAFRQAGAEIGAATLGQGLISDPIDKVVTFLVVYLVVQAMSRRALARFPQGERLVASHAGGGPATES